MKAEITFTVKHGLTKENILDILTTAFEGGIDYWGYIDYDDPDWVEAHQQWKKEHNGEACICDVAYQTMQNGKAVKIIHGKHVHKLTMEAFINGCKLFSEKNRVDIHQFMEESTLDAEHADCIIQYALYSDIKWG